MIRNSPEQSTNIQKSKIAYLDGRAKQFNGVSCFFTRLGGYSKPPKDSLNFSNAAAESGENITRNLKVVSDFLSIDPDSIVMCDQRHSDVIVKLYAPPSSMPVADAIIAEKPGIFPAIRTADCLPILMLDPVSRVSAAIHAGWRGTVQRITLKVLKTLVLQLNVEPDNLLVAIGPAIGVCCYEVGSDVIDQIVRNIPDGERHVITRRNQNAGLGGSSGFLDLVAINVAEIVGFGVPSVNIAKVGACTSCRNEQFFSYRREGVNTGRQISIVGFRS